MPIRRPVVNPNTSNQFDLFPGWEFISVEEERPEPTVGVNF